MLDLSTPHSQRAAVVHWIVPVAMIAVYGSYLGYITGSKRLDAHRPVDSVAIAKMIEPPGFAGSAALKKDDLESDQELARSRMTDLMQDGQRERHAAIDGGDDQLGDDRLSVLDAEEAPEVELRTVDDQSAVQPVEVAIAPRKVKPEPPVIVHAWQERAAIAPAAYAILERINKAAEAWDTAAAQADTREMESARLQTVAIPFPERRPFTTEEIASQELSSQRVARLSELSPPRPEALPSVVRTYRSLVRAHLAAYKPTGGDGAGRVSVAFKLSPDGRIVSLRIVGGRRASALKDRAMNAVHHAEPFPPAPEIAKRAHRKFTVSYIFE